MQDNLMELQFEIDIADCMALQNNHLKNSKHFKRTKLLVLWFVPILFCFFILIDVLQKDFNPIHLVLYGSVTLIWILFVEKRFGKRILKKAKKEMEKEANSKFLGPIDLSINADGLILCTQNSKNEYNWNTIKKLEETSEYYFLYNSSESAIILPKNKIEVELDELDILIKSNLKTI